MNHDATLPLGTKLPLICSYTDTIVGNGFVAKVETRGRILAVAEEDGVWLHAVDPTGWAEAGCTLHEAFPVYRQAYTAMLFDLADEAKSFDEFRGLVGKLHQASDALTESWKDAVAHFRLEWAEQLNLRVEPSGLMPQIKVSEVSVATSGINQLEPVTPALAKAA